MERETRCEVVAVLDDRKVKLFLLLVIVTLTIGLAVKAFVGFKNIDPITVDSAPVVAKSQGQAPSQGQGQGNSQEIVVYVTGAVTKQGLVKLPPGARMADALNAAGQQQDADLASLNLAEKLRDGQKIVVLRIGDNKLGSAPANATSAANQSASQGSVSSDKVNINTAGLKELDTLPGVGPATAEKIIAYRNENGPFYRPEGLIDVPGIGEKKFAQMANLVTVD